MPARTTALRALMTCRVSGGWSDAVLKDAMNGLSSKDAALCASLYYGVLQNRALLDYYLDSLLTGRKHLQPVLRDILRLGAYQILFLDRVPDSAAVNEAVRQAKDQLGQRQANLCNGVLRNLSRQKDSMEPPKDYAIRYSHPQPLVDLMKASVGKRLGTILASDNTSPETCAQWNPLQCKESELLEAWKREGVTASPHSWMPHCYLLRGTGRLDRLDSFLKGWFQVQDPAARLSVQVLELQPGMRVLDLCAAPGGKSMAAASEMENRGEILACDIYEGKLEQIRQAARRLGVSILQTEVNDASCRREEWEGQFDAVIADVPCSGLGVIRKKPDIRYKELSGLEALPPLQRRILEQAAAYVRPGGQLMYSTCTILRRENEDVAEAFLREHSEFATEAMALPEPLSSEREGMLTLYQGIHDCDGFFMCRMRRQTGAKGI